VQWKSRAAGFESSRAFCHDGTMGFIFQKLHLFKEKQPFDHLFCLQAFLFVSSWPFLSRLSPAEVCQAVKMALGSNLEELEPLLFQLPVSWLLMRLMGSTETKDPKSPKWQV
jgi:hypothetical protein